MLPELKLVWSKDSTRSSFDGPAKFKLRRFPGVVVTSVVMTYGGARLPLSAGQSSSKENEAYVTEFKSLEGSRPDAVAVRFKALLHAVEGVPRSRVTVDARRPNDASAHTVAEWVDLLDWLEARASAHAAARSSPGAHSAPPPPSPPAASSAAAAAAAPAVLNTGVVAGFHKQMYGRDHRPVVGGFATPQHGQQLAGSQRTAVGKPTTLTWALGRSAVTGAPPKSRADGGSGTAEGNAPYTPASSSSSNSVLLLAKSAPSSALGGYGGLTK